MRGWPCVLTERVPPSGVGSPRRGQRTETRGFTHTLLTLPFQWRRVTKFWEYRFSPMNMKMSLTYRLWMACLVSCVNKKLKELVSTNDLLPTPSNSSGFRGGANIIWQKPFFLSFWINHKRRTTLDFSSELGRFMTGWVSGKKLRHD